MIVHRRDLSIQHNVPLRYSALLEKKTFTAYTKCNGRFSCLHQVYKTFKKTRSLLPFMKNL